MHLISTIIKCFIQPLERFNSEDEIFEREEEILNNREDVQDIFDDRVLMNLKHSNSEEIYFGEREKIFIELAHLLNGVDAPKHLIFSANSAVCSRLASLAARRLRRYSTLLPYFAGIGRRLILQVPACKTSFS